MKLIDILKEAIKVAVLGTFVQGLITPFKNFADAKAFFVQQFATFSLLMGISSILAKGSEDTTGRNLGIKSANTDPIGARNVVYGKTRVGGTIVQRTVSGANQTNDVLHLVIAVAGHEINNITKIFIDGGKGVKELSLSSDFASATENSATVFRCTHGDFVNADNDNAYTGGSLIKLTFEKGDQTTANGYAVAQMSPISAWSTDHKMLGIAYVYINCIFDTEKFTAIPQVSFEVEGKKVFDPADTNQNQNDPTTFTFSTNPALIIRDYLMDNTYGFGATSNEINDATTGAGFVKARSDCNDSVSITSGTESRYTLNGQFNSTEEPQKVLDHMLSACAGHLSYNNGKFNLFVGKERTASGTITDDKLLSGIQIQTKSSIRDLHNGVKATFVRPSDKYIGAEITPYKDSTYLTEDTPSGEAQADYEKFLNLSFPFTQSSFTAQRLARIALDYQRQDQTLSVLVPLEFMTHQVGDVLNFDNDRLGYSGKDFEIVSIAFEFVDETYLALRLALKEYSTTVYDTITYVADPTLPSAPPSGDNGVNSPTGLTLTELVKDAQVRFQSIRVTWTNNSDEKIIATEVAFKKSTDSNFDAVSVNYPTASAIFSADPATTYNVKVRHITASGVRSDFTSTVNLTTSGGQVTLTTGTISGITIESGKLYQGTGTFNNSNTGFYIDSTGQFSLKDKLSFNGTTLNISGNLTVENTISADKIVVGGITLDNLISASDQASSNYLTTFAGAVKIASGGASAGYPAELQIQATEHTNAIGTLQQSQTQLTIRARNNTSNGAIAFQGFNGTTPTNYGNFDASGNLNLNQNLVVSGDLTVSGTTTTVDTTNTNVKDNNLTLNYSTGDSSSTANGAGLTIQDAVSASTDATILWDATNDEFDFSHKITTPSIQTSGASIIDELTVTNDFLVQGSIDVGSGTIDCGAIISTGDLTIPDKIIHSGDTNTAIRFPSADTVTIETAGSERVRIDSSGNVGIGTNSPNYLLDVEGTGSTLARLNSTSGSALFQISVPDTTSICDINFGDTGHSQRGQIRYRHNGDSLAFSTAQTEAMRIDSSGNFGLGTTSPAGNLHVVGASGSAGRIYLSDADNGTGAGDALLLTKSGTTSFIYNRDNGQLRLGANDQSDYVTIDTDGDVGIGTTSPTGKLNIVSGSSGSYLVNLDYNDGTDGGGFFQSGSVGLSLFLKNASATQTVQIATAGDSYFNGGDVGIGLTSPSTPLHVKTNSSGYALTLEENSGSEAYQIGTDSFGGLVFYNSGTKVAEFADANNFQLYHSGAVKINLNQNDNSFINNDFNFGIGDTSPLAKLEVAGSIKATNRSTGHTGEAGVTLSYNTSSQIALLETWQSKPLVIDTFNYQQFNIGNTLAMFIDGTNRNVGINTNSPSFKLDVAGNARASYFALRSNESAPSETSFIYRPATGVLAFGTASTERLRIDSSGNVGIGTTSPDSSAKLTLQDADFAGLYMNLSDSSGTSIVDIRGAVSGTEKFRLGKLSSSSDNFSIRTGGSTALTIDTSQRVGIGTTSPAEKLHIDGSIRFTGSLKPDGSNAFEKQSSTIFVGDRDDNDLILDLSGFSESTAIEMNDGFMRFKSQGAEKIRMDSSGNLFVGKTASNSANTGVELKSGGLFSATRADSPAGIFNRTTSNGQLVQFRRNNTTVGSVFVDTSATTYNTSSDARLKDVTGYARGLKVINKLNPVAFNWKANGKADEGLIAQEVEKLVPNAVNVEDDHYQMDYSKLVVHLIAGMQEQQEQIDRLQADSHTPKGLGDMDGYKDLLAVIEKLQEEVKLLKGVN